MFYYLARFLQQMDPGFGVLYYITFRAALAAITAFGISFVIGPKTIAWLRRLEVTERKGKQECAVLDEMHAGKRGTPTMGGILLLASIVASGLLWGNLGNRFVTLALGITLSFGLVGLLDDLKKLRAPLGVRPRIKLVGEVILGLCLGFYLLRWGPEAAPLWQMKIEEGSNYLPYLTREYGSSLAVPFFKNVFLNLSWFYVIFVALVTVGTSNAVNLTDGLDGLAVGSVSFVSLIYMGLAYLAGNWQMARYLNILFVEGSGELTVFCAAVVGAGLGFLWFNCYPAEVFMGDTGSLALGGALGVVAVLIKQEILLLVAGGLFVVETLSVILQVGSFRLRGKRIFSVAPIHHHFEVRGWAEPKVVVRFWIMAAIFALLALSTLKVR